MDRFTKVCLVAIVFLLAVIALRPFVSLGVVEAANGKKYEFKFEDQYVNSGKPARQMNNGYEVPDLILNPQLAKDGLDGWQVVAVTTNNNLILERDAVAPVAAPKPTPPPNIYK